MLLQGTVGPLASAADTTSPPSGLRQARTGDLIVSELHGKYYEQASRGNLFYAAQAPAGVLFTNAAATANFALANPSNSGVNVSIIRVGFVIKVLPGTPVIGFYGLYVNTNPVGAAVTGTALTAIALPLGSAAQPKAKPFTTATLPAAPTLLEPLWQKTTTAEAPVQPPPPFAADIDGRIVLAPGTAISLQQDAADTTNATAVCFVAWEEVPV